MKASIPYVHTNSHRLYDILHFTAFAAGSVQLKKPSVGPKGLIGPPCHGAPGRRRQRNLFGDVVNQQDVSMTNIQTSVFNDRMSPMGTGAFFDFK